MNEWLLLQEGLVLYGALFALLLGGAIGLPMPEDIPLILAGVLVQTGKVEVFAAFLVCYIGIIAGDVFIFYIGKKLGPSLFQKEWFKARFSQSKIKHVRFRLEKRSLLMILIARHLFYLRTATFLVCGAVKMKLSRFLLADALAALISAPLMMLLGYAAAEHYNLLLEGIKDVKFVMLAIAILCIAAYLLYVYKRKTKAKKIHAPRPGVVPDTSDCICADPSSLYKQISDLSKSSNLQVEGKSNSKNPSSNANIQIAEELHIPPIVQN